MDMGNKGYANRAKSGQKAVPAKLKRLKAQAEVEEAKTESRRRKRRRQQSRD
jgi:hypothetical protein